MTIISLETRKKQKQILDVYICTIVGRISFNQQNQINYPRNFKRFTISKSINYIIYIYITKIRNNKSYTKWLESIRQQIQL